MATSPATAPEPTPTHRRSAAVRPIDDIEVSAATAVAIWVTIIAMPACKPRGDRRAGVEPEPADPQKPRADEGQNHVVRPRRSRLALAEQEARHEFGDAALMWTTVPPAKSRTWRAPWKSPLELTLAALMNPSAPDPVGDRRVDEDRRQADEHSMAENFIRSANEPAMSAGVMMANVIWNIM